MYNNLLFVCLFRYPGASLRGRREEEINRAAVIAHSRSGLKSDIFYQIYTHVT